MRCLGMKRYIIDNTQKSYSDMDKQNRKALIMIPFVYLDGYKSGVNVENIPDKLNLYLKNCSVACVSARAHNADDVDVALVTNIDVPQHYQSIFDNNNILVYKTDFDRFYFGKDYRWSLAFFKLCALSHIAEDYEYQYYSYLDSDVYVQDSFDDIWKECSSHIMLYDFNHGLQAKAYKTFVEEINTFSKLYNIDNLYITHWGGSFMQPILEIRKGFLMSARRFTI